MAGSSIIKAVYGYEATGSNDTLFETVSHAVHGFSRAMITSSKHHRQSSTNTICELKTWNLYARRFLCQLYPLDAVYPCLVPWSAMETTSPYLALANGADVKCAL
jgi:hypothetical protein